MREGFILHKVSNLVFYGYVVISEQDIFCHHITIFKNMSMLKLVYVQVLKTYLKGEQKRSLFAYLRHLA